MPVVQVAATPADVARAADITFAMLADPEAAWVVGAGPDGVAAGGRVEGRSNGGRGWRQRRKRALCVCVCVCMEKGVVWVGLQC